MSKEKYTDFVNNWLKIYQEQYKKGNIEERREIKNNIYKNIGLTEREKDRLWNLIVSIFK